MPLVLKSIKTIDNTFNCGIAHILLKNYLQVHARELLVILSTQQSVIVW